MSNYGQQNAEIFSVAQIPRSAQRITLNQDTDKVCESHSVISF